MNATIRWMAVWAVALGGCGDSDSDDGGGGGGGGGGEAAGESRVLDLCEARCSSAQECNEVLEQAFCTDLQDECQANAAAAGASFRSDFVELLIECSDAIVCVQGDPCFESGFDDLGTTDDPTRMALYDACVERVATCDLSDETCEIFFEGVTSILDTWDACIQSACEDIGPCLATSHAFL